MRMNIRMQQLSSHGEVLLRLGLLELLVADQGYQDQIKLIMRLQGLYRTGPLIFGIYLMVGVGGRAAVFLT